MHHCVISFRARRMFSCLTEHTPYLNSSLTTFTRVPAKPACHSTAPPTIPTGIHHPTVIQTESLEQVWTKQTWINPLCHQPFVPSCVEGDNFKMCWASLVFIDGLGWQLKHSMASFSTTVQSLCVPHVQRRQAAKSRFDTKSAPAGPTAWSLPTNNLLLRQSIIQGTWKTLFF